LLISCSFFPQIQFAVTVANIDNRNILVRPLTPLAHWPKRLNVYLQNLIAPERHNVGNPMLANVAENFVSLFE
jgi:hypothetical protein